MSWQGYNDVKLIPLRALTKAVQRLALGVTAVCMNPGRRTIVVFADDRYHQYPIGQLVAKGIDRDIGLIAFAIVKSNGALRRR